MKKLILIVFTLMIANTTFATGENASTECVHSDQSSRSAQPVVVDNTSASTESDNTGSGSQQ